MRPAPNPATSVKRDIERYYVIHDFRAGGLTINAGAKFAAAVCYGKTDYRGCAVFIFSERNYSPGGIAVDYCGRYIICISSRQKQRPQYNVMAVEIDILDISARLYEHRISVCAGVDTLLDSGVVSGDVDYGGPADATDHY